MRYDHITSQFALLGLLATQQSNRKMNQLRYLVTGNADRSEYAVYFYATNITYP